MTGKVFLNYRRADAEAWADRLFERLVQQFPREHVFMDVNGHIPVGFSWADWLDSQVATCDLMLVLIGRSWVAEFKRRSKAGERDYVRVEIESALRRKIPVVPVLLGEAQVPKASELPETLRPLLGLQAARLHRRTFDSDAETLAKDVARSIALARGETVAGEGSVPRKQTSHEAARYQAEGRIKGGAASTILPVRDVPVVEALAYICFGSWGRRFVDAAKSPDVSANWEYNQFHQAAADGDIPVWGKTSRADVYEPLAKEFWLANKIEWFSLLKGKSETEPNNRNDLKHKRYIQLMTSRRAVELMFLNQPPEVLRAKSIARQLSTLMDEGAGERNKLLPILSELALF